jgi:hypothetical protein
MKLAEALILRAEQQKRLQQLLSRATRNAKVQEGDSPAENPATLLTEYRNVTRELVTLIQRINRTNSQTPFEGHGTIADAIAERDGLRKSAEALRTLAEAGQVSSHAYSRSEIRFRTTVSVPELQNEADDLSRRHRELDAAIQSLNWSVDLVE